MSPMLTHRNSLFLLIRDRMCVTSKNGSQLDC
jgi:hypothetical protein